jgi:hypothetical protein
VKSDAGGTQQKALAINLDPRPYGVFAEIGAGQEVARWFFQVGGAAGTVAKTISAYDMTVSTALYGSASRYVSRSRLAAMLEHEFAQLVARLGSAAQTGPSFSYSQIRWRRAVMAGLIAGAAGWESDSRLIPAENLRTSSFTLI